MSQNLIRKTLVENYRNHFSAHLLRFNFETSSNQSVVRRSQEISFEELRSLRRDDGASYRAGFIMNQSLGIGMFLASNTVSGRLVKSSRLRFQREREKDLKVTSQSFQLKRAFTCTSRSPFWSPSRAAFAGSRWEDLSDVVGGCWCFWVPPLGRALRVRRWSCIHARGWNSSEGSSRSLVSWPSTTDWWRLEPTWDRPVRWVPAGSAKTTSTLWWPAGLGWCCKNRSSTRCRSSTRSSARSSDDPASSVGSRGDGDDCESNRVAPRSFRCCRCSASSSAPACSTACWLLCKDHLAGRLVPATWRCCRKAFLAPFDPKFRRCWPTMSCAMATMSLECLAVTAWTAVLMLDRLSVASRELQDANSIKSLGKFLEIFLLCP